MVTVPERFLRLAAAGYAGEGNTTSVPASGPPVTGNFSAIAGAEIVSAGVGKGEEAGAAAVTIVLVAGPVSGREK